jgi:AcrR family transcriptional regulator
VVATKPVKATPERILDAALECFAAEGYSGTSTRTLAAAAGVNVATLAYHFKGKEGLYRAVIDRLYERFFAVQPDLDLGSDSTPAQRVEAAARFIYRFCCEHRSEVRLLIRHVIEHGHLPDKVRGEWTEQLLERAQVAWVLLGLEPDPDWKLKLLTLNHLIARFAITADADLAPFVSGDDPHAVVEDHVVQVALQILGVK